VNHPFVFRPNTHDEGVFHAVNTHNEYRLPETFRTDDVIIDIGTHIGSFCYAALVRGSNHVYGFEASPENFARARQNLASFGARVQLRHQAVWRSDINVQQLSFWECTANNGGGQVWRENAGPSLAAVAFDDVVSEVTRSGRKRVRMVKVDCEGSEYPILLTAKTLHLVDEIVGEFHEFGTDDEPHPDINAINRVPGYDRYTIKVLKQALESAGFDVAVEYHPSYPQEPLGWWWATRKQPSAIPAPHFFGWARLGRKVRSVVE
jgi:FkbM family methyltransferase